jgi:hypothetical protein
MLSLNWFYLLFTPSMGRPILNAARVRQETSLQVRGSAQVASVPSLESIPVKLMVMLGLHDPELCQHWRSGNENGKYVSPLPGPDDHCQDHHQGTKTSLWLGLSRRRAGQRLQTWLSPLATPGVVTSQEISNVILEVPKSTRFTDFRNLIETKGTPLF